MALRFFVKKFPKRNNIVSPVIESETKVEVEETKTSNKKNKKEKNTDDMNINDKVKQAEETLNAMEPEVKVVKRDKGLIERTESSKIILTEDNRQLLVD
jgi:hypothetical protein